MEKNYRINTNITKDKLLNVQLQQDVDFLEILSLKISQEDTYKLHSSSYGVIVGRVLANDAFGIPNAKVSVFIELEDADRYNSEIANLYPYSSISTNDRNGIRYNLLPDTSNDDCYKVVGTFPNKRLVLDDESVLEVFDKYWKYTTVTNRAGDYMIFGVPNGSQQIHVDIDLSDIGILSQKPRDMIYKGYNITQFESSNQFKESTNLDGLSQLYSQNESVNVYPFWGDASQNEIAITRCDIQIQYKFEPTCIFMGSVITDNFGNNIGHNCSPSKYAGFNRDLVTSEGTIEMIRKTVDGLVEEYQIQGNRLIDSDGIWCYQIPMNLDYVSTDEYGNIIPTDNPKKGIPTKSSVRFRISVQETPSDDVSRHRAKYLIPNNPLIVEDSMTPKIPNGRLFDNNYEFGSATPDECYRDLYWNKVYSIKNYIPRIQNNAKDSAQNYSALRTCNVSNSNNPIPFNRMRFRLVIAYRLLCMIMTVVVWIITGINTLLSGLQCICFPWPLKGFCPFKKITPECIRFAAGISEDEDANIEYFPGCKDCGKRSCSNRGCTIENSPQELLDTVQQQLSQEYDLTNLDFYNDWLNGSLYAPLWYWKKTKKKTFFFGLFSKRGVNSYCGCKHSFPRLRVIMPCSLRYKDADFKFEEGDGNQNWHRETAPTLYTNSGVIKDIENRDGLIVYYYAPGVPTDMNYRSSEEAVNYIRLYSTDIILLGSLNSCDLDSYPQPFLNLPTTSANVPFIVTVEQNTSEDGRESGVVSEKGLVEITGMDWGHKGYKKSPKYGSGLLFDLSCDEVRTRPKSCVNIERMCEIGVSLDIFYQNTVARNGNIHLNNIKADGMITRYELVDNKTRSMFASLNHNGLTNKVLNKNTGYDTYKLQYMCPNDFDGRMAGYCTSYTNKAEFKTYDYKDISYIDYRMGPNKRHYYFPSNYQFPLFNNSFYFYFGLNEGSTAIDKFNKLFFSTCYKKSKFPFLMSYDKTPARWCIKNNLPKPFESEYGTITVNLTNIKLPYSYILSDEFDNELIREDNLYITDLHFGVAIAADGGSYEKNADGTFKKEGRLTYFNNGSFVTPQQLLTNRLYKLNITDAKGQSVTQLIDVVQNSINLTYRTASLGTKYNEGDTIIEEICNENDLYGNIIITNVIIDGFEYNLTKIVGIGDGKYKVSCVNKNDNKDVYDVLLELSPTVDGNRLLECLCNNTTEINPYTFEKNIVSGLYVLTFNVWIPGDYNVRVTQYCNGVINDNMVNIIANVNNGAPFEMMLNEVPMRVIIGKNTEINAYNKNFYNPNAKAPSDLKGWFNLHKENNYVFMGITEEFHSVWETYIGSVETEMVGEIPIMTRNTKQNVLEYKFDSMFILANSAYVTETSTSIFAVTHTGGKTPILYRGVYPKYNNLDGNETVIEPLKQYLADSLAYTVCNQAFPNVVGYNYAQNNQDGTITQINPTVKTPYFNTLFDSANIERLGNYFAIFTQNGGIIPDVDTCKLDTSIKTQQNPNKANVLFQINGEINCPSNEIEMESIPLTVINKTTNNNPYFRAEFVDRRMDYDYLILTPYTGSDIILTDDNTTNITNNWKLARFSGTSLNGIEMAYNRSTFNVIDESKDTGLEYYYDINNAISYYNDGADAKKNRSFYKVVIRANGETVDLRNMFWSNDKNPTMFSNLTSDSKEKFYYFDHSSDRGLYNGEFDTNNYPIKRLVDVGNIPSGSRMSFSGTSCSYGISLEDSPSGGINGITDSGETSSFEIDCRNMITVSQANLDGYVNDNKFNVLYGSTGGGKTLTFKSQYLNIHFGIKEDTFNTTHLMQTKMPKIVKVKYTNGNQNTIDKVKKAKSITEIENIINSQSVDCGASLEGIYKGDDGFFYENETNARIYDDSQEFKKLIFTIYINNNFSSNGRWGPKIVGAKITTLEVFAILIDRRYHNASRDNLLKTIRAIELGSLYDCKPFIFNVNKIDVEEIVIDPPVVTPETPDAPKTPIVMADEPPVDPEPEPEPEPEPTPEPVRTQITDFEIVLDKDSTTAFANDDETATFVAKFRFKDKTVIKKDVETVTEYDETTNKINKIILKMKWTGDMSGMFLADENKQMNYVQIFTKTTNGLIYAFSFGLSSDGEIHRDAL